MKTEEDTPITKFVKYSWKSNSGWNHIEVNADAATTPIEISSEEEFITEHYWGYAGYSSKKTNEYQVEHPRWNVHAVQNHQILCNFAELYGTDFAFLKDTQPTSVLLAEGSDVAVFKGKVII